jgi:hypothetical protein
VLVTAVMEAQGGTNLAPVTTRLVLYGSLPYADLEITLLDKPLGKAIPVQNGRFSFDLGAFAPASFVMAVR